ncbi:MAG: DUF4097 family beta strand repeat-containing protein [Bacteroidota bacterium]
MKAFRYRIAATALALSFLVVPFLLNAQEEVVREINREFQTNENITLDITNKFGHVVINDWNEMRITINVKITVKSKNKEVAEKKQQYINILFSEDEENIIKIITEIDDRISEDNSFFRGRSDDFFSIDYTVNMPRNQRINLYNKYGDVLINEIHGKSDIKVKYGDLKAQKLIFDDSKPLSKISVSYGNANISKCNWLTIVSNYSHLNLTEGTAVVIVSKYSDIKMNNVNSIVSEAKFDKYTILKVNNFVTTAEYTDFEIEFVGQKLDLDVKYGNVTVNNIPNGFENIFIDSKYIDIDLNIAADASYQLDASVKYGNIDIPKKANIETHNSVTSSTVKGTVGADQNSAAVVKVSCEYGNVDLDK